MYSGKREIQIVAGAVGAFLVVSAIASLATGRVGPGVGAATLLVGIGSLAVAAGDLLQ